MPDIAPAIRGLLSAVRAAPPVYADIRQHCEQVRPLLLNPNNPNVPAPDLPARLVELLERIWHPGPTWFITRGALAVELLTKALEAVGDAKTRNDLASAILPSWDETELELRFGDWSRRYRRNAESQMAVLAEFQKQRWRRRIKDHPNNTFSDLRDTVRNLNRSLGNNAPIRFSRDGTGDGLRWDPVSE
jgi:hypothetical protein